jgi:DNA-binding SARP family transcriptional activator/predicted ATPase
MESLRLRMLGGMHIIFGDRPIASDLSKKAQALFCYLAVSGRPQSRDTLAGLLWSDFPQSRARANLRDALSDLNRVLSQHLEINQHLVAFVDDAQSRDGCSWIDAVLFQRDIDEVHQSFRSTPSAAMLPAELAAKLEAALKLYRGEFLDGFYVRRAALFEEWVIGQRELLHQSAVEALQILTEYYSVRGDYQTAQSHAAHMLRLDPWREEGYRQLMRLLSLSGEQSAALKQYETCRQVLMDELGLEPGPDTTSLYEAIRAGELRPGKLEVRRQSYLPPDETPFIGREEELATLERLLCDPAVRLINISGPGGVGKTRLALALARRNMNRYENGIYFVPLAAVESIDHVFTAIAAVLDLPILDEGSPQERLIAYLSSKDMLLILDNFEQLVKEKGLLAEILASTRRLSILVTSREVLNLREEQVYPLTGLTLPGSADGDAMLLADASKLFLQSARRQLPDFTLYEGDFESLLRICNLVEGLPLAIEMAAGWSNKISLDQIAVQLRRSIAFLETEEGIMPERHKSITAVFDATWRQLDREEQQTFMTLSVFRGGFTLQAAQKIAGIPFIALSKLVSKSLLKFDREVDRYQMHELLRQYAAMRLARDPHEESAVLLKHATYYLWLLSEKEEDLKGVKQDVALAEIEADLANIRKSWRTAAAAGRADLLSEAIDSLALYYKFRFLPDQFVNDCQIARKNLKESGVDRSNLQLKRALAKIAIMQAVPYFHATVGSDYLAKAQNLAVLEQCQRDFQELTAAGEDVRKEQAFLAMRLGTQLLNLEPSRATPLLEESLALYRQLGDRWGQSEALLYLSSARLRLQGYQVARPLWEESLAIKREEGNYRGMAEALAMLGMRAMSHNETADAQRYAQECFDTYRRISDRASLAEANWNYGVIMAWSGQYAEAKTSLQKAEELYSGLGLRPPAQVLGNVLAMLGEYDAVTEYVENYQAWGKNIDDVPNDARAYHWLAYVAMVHGNLLETKRLCLKAITAYEACGLIGYAGLVYGLLALAVWRSGNTTKSWFYLQKGLRGQLVFLGNWLCAPFAAVLLADSGRYEEAVTAYACATNHPMVANSVWYKDVAGKVVQTVESKLDPRAVEKARRHGLESDPIQIAEELLELVDEIAVECT